MCSLFSCQGVVFVQQKVNCFTEFSGAAGIKNTKICTSVKVIFFSERPTLENEFKVLLSVIRYVYDNFI